VDKCTASGSEGACFNTDDTDWQCWSPAKPETDEYCTSLNFAGACEYKGHVASYTHEADVPPCKNVTNFKSQCNPPQDHWGACYDDTNQWKCISADQKENVMKGDCQVQQSLADPNSGFKGVCKFSDAPQVLYKCDSVPSYVSEGAGACGEGTESACFATETGINWLCGELANLPENCVTLQIDPEQPDTWSGVCLYKGADGYNKAQKYPSPAHSLEVV